MEKRDQEKKCSCEDCACKRGEPGNCKEKDGYYRPCDTEDDGEC